MIACDTSCLSWFFRRRNAPESKIPFHIEELIFNRRLALFGIVRQELLSGIKFQEQFDRIEFSTRSLPLYLAEGADHITAARFFNICRANGIQASPADILICAMAVRRDFEIYSVDPDFDLYQRFLPIRLYKPMKF